MSRYPSDYRASRDRSRSPPRFSDRRSSVASVLDTRPPGPSRNASDAPRALRTQYDGARQSIGSGAAPSALPRPGYASLRDAPPLGSGDRGRPFRERDYERRDRLPSPRERSPPPRSFKDPRDYPTRDLDVDRARRASREGPPSAGSNYSDGPPFGSAPARGSFLRGRGRGELGFRGGRGGRREFEDRERDLFRRERSPPPPRWGRDLSRDGREPERRDDRRFERRDEDRRVDWSERERDFDRTGRDQPPPRLEARLSNDSLANNPAPQPSNQPTQIDPDRLALIESTGADPLARRSSAPQNAASPLQARRDVQETPAYLNGRAETIANRYNQRGSSPPTQAPPVPAFGFSFTPTAPASAAPNVTSSIAASKPAAAVKLTAPPATKIPSVEEPQSTVDVKPDPPVSAPSPPKAPPPAPKAQLTSPPSMAPKAPRALEVEQPTSIANKLQRIRSLETFTAPSLLPSGLASSRTENFRRPSPGFPVPTSPHGGRPALPTLVEPVSPGLQQISRTGDLTAPTGPRASRMSPAQASVSPRPPLASPRSDNGSTQQGFAGFPPAQTPPPSAPLGPRNKSYSVSPKVSSSVVPTAPKANRGPPLAPRNPERAPAVSVRVHDRLGAPPPWPPPSAPRHLQWNQWRRPGAPIHGDKTVPAKRDFTGEPVDDKVPQLDPGRRRDVLAPGPIASGNLLKKESNDEILETGLAEKSSAARESHKMDVDAPRMQNRTGSASGHSAAQSFFGRALESTEDEPDPSDMVDEMLTSSEDDEVDAQEELALLNAKFERNKRVLESQLADLSTRRYRATTPLESIARLARISSKDLQRIKEHQEMDVDRSPVANDRLLPTTNRSSESDEGLDLQTPKGGDDTQVVIQSSDEGLENARRLVRRPSPEVVTLPYLIKDLGRQDLSEIFVSNVNRQEEAEIAVLDIFHEELDGEERSDESLEDGFIEVFRRWREDCEDFDRMREEQERLERQQSQEPGPEPDVSTGALVNPVIETRRLHKFSSEYEIEQVLKQSEETARIEQERQDREAKKNLADMEKEARLPDQQSVSASSHCCFIDLNRLREPETLTQVFSYEPPRDNFTDEEQRIFIAAFKETPKKWGEIASLLPNRTYKDCIQHYYANKWGGRFRDNKSRKFRANGRRGRGGKAPRGRGAALMADFGRADEFLSAATVSDSGRPKRAAAPTTFSEREPDPKAALLGPSPAKKPGPASRLEANCEAGPEKPGKRRKGMGDKPGRKGKGNQPLAALAAAPPLSPSKQFLQGMHTKEDVARAQNLADAGLLADFQAGNHGALATEGHSLYMQEGFLPPVAATEEPRRQKFVGPSSTAKPSASSYWSVPEQTDFSKYIAHFGTDFAAIAAHMGTKTQTMIKNHYQRQIDNGNRPDLKAAAEEADRRRAAGEDMGAPPTPTPIVKRKYDNPQPAVHRPLAPHTDAMDIDDASQAQRPPSAKHVSPPQYQAQPRVTTSAQATPIPAQRAMLSPVPSTSIPAVSQTQTAPARSLQHPLGSRLAFLSDAHGDSRPGMPPSGSLRLAQDTPSRAQQQQPNRSIPDARDPAYIRNLLQEQERALQVQESQSQQERMDQLQRHSILNRNSSHGSPANPPLANASERQPFGEERAATPPRVPVQSSAFLRTAFGQSLFGQSPSPFPSSLTGRQRTNPSPPKREEPQTGSISTSASGHPAPPPTSSAPPHDPPKRSNLLSILNDEPEEPKSVKRESLPSMSASNPPSSASSALGGPAQAPLPPMATRRETFGQPSIPQSHFQRSSFSQPSQAPASHPPTLKHEQSPASRPHSQGPKPDWTTGVFRQAPQPSRPSTPPLEREARPLWTAHRASLFSLNSPGRANPSPPPRPMVGHSRTPSLTTQATQQREQRPTMPAQQTQSATHQSTQSFSSTPFAQHPASTRFSHSPKLSSQLHAHHAHNTASSDRFPGMHPRGLSREDAIRQHEQAIMAQREREEQERMRWQRDAVEADRQREAHYRAQMQHEQEQQQAAFARGPPPPQHLHPPTHGVSSFASTTLGGLREQALRDLREEEQRRMQEVERRRQDALQDAMMREREEIEYRRRQEEYRRHTPLNGSYRPSAGPR